MLQRILLKDFSLGKIIGGKTKGVKHKTQAVYCDTCQECPCRVHKQDKHGNGFCA